MAIIHIIKISIPIGERIINDVPNGRYNANHVALLNSPATDNIIIIKGNDNITIDILFILGYTTPGAPTNIGVI